MCEGQSLRGEQKPPSFSNSTRDGRCSSRSPLAALHARKSAACPLKPSSASRSVALIFLLLGPGRAAPHSDPSDVWRTLNTHPGCTLSPCFRQEHDANGRLALPSIRGREPQLAQICRSHSCSLLFLHFRRIQEVCFRCLTWSRQIGCT